MLRNFAGRLRAQNFQITTWLLAAALVVAGLATPSVAALMGTYSLRLDAHVKSGANTGVEGHFNPNIPYSIGPYDLPGTTDPPAPLLPARDLKVTATEPAQKITISITNTTNDAKLGALFNNPLDPALPVEWEALFAWTNVPANSKVAITNIGFVQMDETTVLAPASQSVSGLGTVADPLKVLLTFNPSQFNPTPNNQIIGPLKVFLDYNFMNTIPEPASAVLALLGLVGCGRLGRRR